VTLDDKRKAIEVLLCTGDHGNPDGSVTVALDLELDGTVAADLAYESWATVDREPAFNRDVTRETMSNAYTEAAYRLIESSPTLRREWFGVR
jgi:hypothetical protein